MSSPKQQHPRRRNRANNTSVIATTAATAVFAYSTYRLARWYCEDDDNEEGIQRPLEEDLSSFLSGQQPQEQQQQQRGGAEKYSNRNDTASTATHNESYGKGNGVDDNNNHSWLSTAAIGVADWLLNTNGNNQQQQQRSKRSTRRLTRRQLLDRCRNQTRIAFLTCFPTLKPVIEKLTDSSIQTKELKALRRYRIQKLKQQREQEHEPEIEQNQPEKNDNDSNNTKICKNNGIKQREQVRKYEHELQKVRQQEEELWCEILVDTTTRMMVSSYAYALLLMSLTVQFHWLTSSQQNQQQQLKQENQAEAMLMRSHQYLLNEGIPLLVKTVRRSVEKVLFNNDEDENFDDGITRTTNNRDKDDTSSPASCWNNPSTQFVTCKEVEQVLYRRLPVALNDVGSDRGRGNRRHRNWIRFVLPDEELFDPMWDICRSPVWEDAQEQVLESLWYRILRDGNNNNNNNNDNDVNSGWGSLFQSKDGNCCVDGEGIDVNVENNDRNNLRHQQRKPLAKAMAQFKKVASVLFDDVGKNKIDNNASERTTTIGKLQTLPTVLELGDVSFQ